MERTSTPAPASNALDDGCADASKYISQANRYITRITLGALSAEMHIDQVTASPDLLRKQGWRNGIGLAIAELRKGANGLQDLNAPSELDDLERALEDSASATMFNALDLESFVRNGDLSRLNNIAVHSANAAEHLGRAETEINWINLACGS